MDFVLSLLGGFFAGFFAQLICILVVVIYWWLTFKINDKILEKHLGKAIIGAIFIYVFILLRMTYLFGVSGWQFLTFGIGFVAPAFIAAFLTFKFGTTELDDDYNSLG